MMGWLLSEMVNETSFSIILTRLMLPIHIEMVWLPFGMNKEMSVAMILREYCFMYTLWWYVLSLV